MAPRDPSQPDPRGAGRVRAWILVAALALSAVVAGAAIAWKGNDMPQQQAPRQEAAPLATVQGVEIDQPTVAVKLPIPRSGQPAARLRQALAAPTGRARVELVLDDITVAKPPGVLFNVYLATGQPPRREYVGTLSFFGVRYGSSGPTEVPRRKLEVARELKTLLGGSPEIPELQVVFEATEGDAGSTPAKARARFDREAGITIGSIHLVVQE